jgi:hypothetical protein
VPLPSGRPGQALALPPAPFLEAVSPEGLGGLVSWAPDPAAAAVTSYSIEALPAPNTTPKTGCSTVVVSAGPSNSAAVVNGLCTGMAYVTKVRAVNATGAGAWSSSSNPFVPLAAQAPSSPLITSVVARDKSLLVNWSAPAVNGGKPITGYVLQATAGSTTATVNAAASSGSATISGLVDGTTYAVSLVASNSVGKSSPASGTGVPKAAYAPAAPQDVTVAPSGTGAIDVAWHAPADDGGSALSAYNVTYEQMERNSAGQWVPAAGAKPSTTTTSASTTSLAISGLSPANAFWSVTVAAVNAVGPGTATPAGQPVAPQTATTANTVALSATTMAGLSTDSGGKLIWPAPAPAQVAALKVGEVLVAGPAAAAPHGLLDTVESVSKSSSGTYVVGIAQAALSDAFTGLSVSSNQNPLNGAGSRPAFHPSVAGVRILRATSKSLSFEQDLTLGIDLGTGPVHVSGELDLSPSVALNIALTKDFIGVPDGALVSASASLHAEASVAASLQGDKEWKIGEIDGAPEDYQVGPVPVIVVPKVPIYLTASGQISTDVHASITVGGAASWDSHHPGALSVKNTSTPLAVSGNPLQNVSGTATIGFKEQPQDDLYDATGPNFEADEDLVATVHPTPAAGQPYFEIGPSLSVSAGWDVDFLSYHVSLEAKIASQSFAPFVIKSPTGAFINVTPGTASVPVGGSQTFGATRSDGSKPSVTWSLLGGAGDTISSAGVLHTVAPAGRNLTVVATDAGGATGVASVLVGSAFDPPSDLQIESAKDGRSASVSWQAPGNTGGSAVSSYTVVTDPQTTTHTVAGSSPSTSLTGLTPGTDYLMSVYATNGAGLRSPAATQDFTPSISCSISWTGTTSNAWSVASNWDQNRVPNADDLVCIDGGSVSLSAATSVYGLTLTDSTLSVGAPVTASDLLSLHGSSGLDGPSSVTVSPGATIDLENGSVLASGVHLINRGTGTIGGQLDDTSVLENAGTVSLADNSSIGWDGASSARLQNDSGAKITYAGGPNGAAIQVAVRNYGTISATSGQLTISQPVTQTSTGTFTGAGAIVLENTFSPSGTGVTLTDVTTQSGIVGPGTVTIPSGGTVLARGAYLSNATLLNRGTLDIGDDQGSGSIQLDDTSVLENAGTVSLADNSSIGWDGASSARLQNDSGAKITYPGGPNGAAIQVAVRNSGTISATSGQLTISQPVTQTSTGTFTGAGAIVLENTFSPSGTGVTLTDVTTQSAIVGPGTVTIPSGGTVGLAGGYLSDVNLVNSGVLGIGSGSPTVQGSTTIDNKGSIALADNTSLGWDGRAGGLLRNDAGATITYSGGTNGAWIDVPFDNAGTVSALPGTLFINAGNSSKGTDSGTYNATSGATIQFSYGVRTFGSGFTSTGPGQLAVSGGTINVPGPISTPDLGVAGGDITGPGPVTIPATGSLTITPGGRMSGGLHVVNDGSATVQSGYSPQLDDAAVLENAGTLTMADGSSLAPYSDDSAKLINDPKATIVYPGGTQGATIDVPFDNHGTVTADVGVRGGTLDIEDSNTTLGADTGTYSATSGGAIQFSSGTRILSTGSKFSGPGQIDVSGGVVAVPGSISVPNLAITGGSLKGPGKVSVPSGGQLTLGAGGHLSGGLDLVNHGTGTVQTGQQFAISGGVVLENAASLEIVDGANVANYPYESGELLNDAGATITYPGGSEGATLGVPFDNHGTVRASVASRGGTLSVTGSNTIGGSDTGVYSVSAGGAIQFAGADRILDPSSTLTGPGAIQVGGGLTTDSAVGNGAGLQVLGGTLEITEQASGQFASFVNDPSGTLQLDVGPSTPTKSPAALVVTGAAQFGGTLTLQEQPDYAPPSGAVLDLVDYKSVSGQYGTINYPQGNETYAITVGNTSLTAAVGGPQPTRYLESRR